MIDDYDNLSEDECILNEWVRKKCGNTDLVIVNGIPILLEDCLSILIGTIAKVKNSTGKLIVTTLDNTDYILESFSKMDIIN